LNAGHRFAFLCASFAGVGAALAVIHVMLAAFLSAGAANFGAQAAELFGEFRIARHELRGQDTDVSAVAVEANAPLHHFDVLFLQARGGAMLAFLRAFQAGFNAASILFVSHNLSPFNKTTRRDSPECKRFTARILEPPFLLAQALSAKLFCPQPIAAFWQSAAATQCFSAKRLHPRTKWLTWLRSVRMGRV
jgi:hypothetical protein